eukprot:2544992-Prymnesium_polylepis.1
MHPPIHVAQPSCSGSTQSSAHAIHTKQTEPPENRTNPASWATATESVIVLDPKACGNRARSRR